jgi:integrase
MPKMPEIPYELGYRNNTDMNTQAKIIDEACNISHDINSRIHLGIAMLSLYTMIRPEDLLRIAESDIDTQYGVITLRKPT